MCNKFASVPSQNTKHPVEDFIGPNEEIISSEKEHLGEAM